ncbi:hypothetical protein ACXZDT_003961 [Escherichia coli]|uniref:hypothetical protein n=1 Tax=Escherichia coli TaxID=562 RepID=UPI0008547090|nr:hypothetical protein [Escherichia coli]ELW2753120.1 hypothetical protein [Escherichia coli O26]EEW0968756.1 hypothetical protein [Escherichia coli]EFC9623131.1 hypothetical protein [Escherichia coli]EFE7288902.1 hypothetical protein [Escherichia coli]EFF1814762.1 hypothetical protein [Escherichia coli]
MNIKIANTTLIGLVSLLLFVAILVLVKILFSGSKGFEWGSFTDWISASSSIITLIFAFYVYSRWQKDKYRDDAYLLQKQIITQHYPKLFITIEKIEFKLKNYRHRVNGYDHHLKDSVLESMQAYLLDAITELEVTSQQLENDINVMKLFRYKPTSEFEKICTAVTNTVELLIRHISNIIALLRGLKMSEFDHVRRKMYNTFDSLIPNTIRLSTHLSEAKTYIFSNNRALNTLFIYF